MVKLIRRHSERDDGGLSLETRRRWPIPNEFRKLDDPRFKLNEAKRWGEEHHPDARLVCLSALYNCGGLVFGARRVCIDPDDFLKILLDDGYQVVKAPLKPGDVVLYRGPPSDRVSHVGLVHCTGLAHLPAQPEPPILVRSKWGDGGEYVHEIHDVPTLLGEPHQYWRFRPCR